MSDDRIIDFNELKNKVKETDIDKFEKIFIFAYDFLRFTAHYVL